MKKSADTDDTSVKHVKTMKYTHEDTEKLNFGDISQNIYIPEFSLEFSRIRKAVMPEWLRGHV